MILPRSSLPLLLMAFPALAVNTAQIIASSLSPDCLHYRIVGICYWLQCTPFGCTVRTSVKVRHNIPELVVSVYAVPGHNPWQEVAFFGAAIPGIAEQGGDTNPREGNPKTKIRFKNADAIGHPGGETFYRFLSGFGYSATARQCRSSLTLSARWMPPPGVPAFPRAFFPKP